MERKSKVKPSYIVVSFVGISSGLVYVHNISVIPFIVEMIYFLFASERGECVLYVANILCVCAKKSYLVFEILFSRRAKVLLSTGRHFRQVRQEK